jgi:hypothetical protein
MTAKRPRSHGKQLVAALTESLPDNLKWTTEETITLGDIENAGDRLQVLRARFVKAARDPEVTENRLAVLSAEIRLLEEAIGRWARSLNAAGAPVQAVSRQHRNAAMIRWHGANA